MNKLGNILLVSGIILMTVFAVQLFSQAAAQQQSLAEAEEKIEETEEAEVVVEEETITEFQADYGESFATLDIPKLERTLPVVEGTDADALKKGVGHLSNSVFPGEQEQILLSGHRDTVFRDFGELEIGDHFIVNMPYGQFTYEIKETEIVAADNTSVIRKMGEEALVVTTCYPFRYIGDAPDRFVIYAYPVDI